MLIVCLVSFVLLFVPPTGVGLIVELTREAGDMI